MTFFQGSMACARRGGKMKLWAVQFRYGSRDAWRWLPGVHGHVEAWIKRDVARHVASQKARYLGHGLTRVVRLDDQPPGATRQRPTGRTS